MARVGGRRQLHVMPRPPWRVARWERFLRRLGDLVQRLDIRIHRRFGPLIGGAVRAYARWGRFIIGVLSRKLIHAALPLRSLTLPRPV